MEHMVLFYDGCHKIYYADCDDYDTLKQMWSNGYETIRGPFYSTVRDFWENSCSLRFISPASLDDNLPHLEQGDDDFDGFINRFWLEFGK